MLARALGILLLCTSATFAHGPDGALHFHADLDWSEIEGLSPLDAVLRVLDLPQAAKDILRSDAPRPVALALPPPPTSPIAGSVRAGAAALPLELEEAER